MKARHKLRHARHALASKRDSKVGDQTGSFRRWVSFRNCSCSTRHVRPCLLACLLPCLLPCLLLAGLLAPSLSLHFFLAARTIEPPAFRTALARFPRPVQSSSRLKEKSNRGCSAFRHSGCEVARGCSCQRAMQAPHIPPKIARPARFLFSPGSVRQIGAACVRRGVVTSFGSPVEMPQSQPESVWSQSTPPPRPPRLSGVRPFECFSQITCTAPIYASVASPHSQRATRATRSQICSAQPSPASAPCEGPARLRIHLPRCVAEFDQRLHHLHTFSPTLPSPPRPPPRGHHTSPSMNSAAIHSAKLIAEFEKEQQASLPQPPRYPSEFPFGAPAAGPFGGASAATSGRSTMNNFADAHDGDAADVKPASAPVDDGASTYQPRRLTDFDYPGGWGAQTFSGVGGLTQDSASRIATLQAKLNQRLGPEYLSQRPGPGGVKRLTYIEGWKVIDLANEVFGFNGWSTTIRKLEIDFLDSPDGTRWSAGVTCILRVTLRDGAFHEDVGYGSADNARQKHVAIEKCKKEAVTDATKRALKNFGKLLGNCLYDHQYSTHALKVTNPPPKFDPAELHRRPELRPPPPPQPQPQPPQTHVQAAQPPRKLAPAPAPAPAPSTSTERAASATNGAAETCPAAAAPAPVRPVVAVAAVPQEAMEEASKDAVSERQQRSMLARQAYLERQQAEARKQPPARRRAPRSRRAPTRSTTDCWTSSRTTNRHWQMPKPHRTRSRCRSTSRAESTTRRMAPMIAAWHSRPSMDRRSRRKRRARWRCAGRRVRSNSQDGSAAASARGERGAVRLASPCAGPAVGMMRNGATSLSAASSAGRVAAAGGPRRFASALGAGVGVEGTVSREAGRAIGEPVNHAYVPPEARGVKRPGEASVERSAPPAPPSLNLARPT